MLLCVCMHTQVRDLTLWSEVRGQSQVSFFPPENIHLVFGDQVFLWDLGFLARLGWLVSEPQESACLCTTTPGSRCCGPPWFFISPVLELAFLLSAFAL